MTSTFGYDVETDENYLELTCDTCGEWDEYEGDTFQQAWRKAMRFGWSAYMVNEKWQHRCPGCTPVPLIK